MMIERAFFAVLEASATASLVAAVVLLVTPGGQKAFFGKMALLGLAGVGGAAAAAGKLCAAPGAGGSARPGKAGGDHPHFAAGQRGTGSVRFQRICANPGSGEWA